MGPAVKNMKIQDMKDIVKDAYELLKSADKNDKMRQSVYCLTLVVSELVAREDERVRKGM